MKKRALTPFVIRIIYGCSGKLKSTDGVYGIRFAHNTDAIVTGLTMTKP